MRQGSRTRRGELFWPKIVLRKWLNISAKNSDFSADEEVDTESEVDYEEVVENESYDSERKLSRMLSNVSTSENIPYKSRRRKSETLRAQYIDTKDLRICVGTWNVGGILPPDDLNIESWIDTEEPADIYVIGIQEIVPLNAGNVLGAEDNRPVPRWESIIRETLNRSRPVEKKYKCYSHPPSPSRFKLTDDAPVIEDEILSETDSESDDEVHPLDDQSFSSQSDEDISLSNKDESEYANGSDITPTSDVNFLEEQVQRAFSPKKLDRLHQFNSRIYALDSDILDVTENKIKLARTLRNSERVGLSWPEQPLNLSIPQKLSSSKPFKSVKSFRTCSSSKSLLGENKFSPDEKVNPEFNRQSLIMFRKKISPFVKVISKQMVGIFISVWVRRSLRKNIQNVKISTVGVGVMGYIGNKGSISVSMSICQTLFCFICSHLTSGEKFGDKLRRNADVQEIHRRTQFNNARGVGLPTTIRDHERIIWLGDLNYRINLSYDKTRELISRKDWSSLAELDQLTRELKKCRAFDGWTEGVLNFPPTYKYELNSENYVGDDPKSGRRTPAWCDRILSFGKGLKLLKYDRSELSISDHRPVTAIYMAEVEVFSPKKLQRALTFTDAEIEEGKVLSDEDGDVPRTMTLKSRFSKDS